MATSMGAIYTRPLSGWCGPLGSPGRGRGGGSSAGKGEYALPSIALLTPQGAVLNTGELSPSGVLPGPGSGFPSGHPSGGRRN